MARPSVSKRSRLIVLDPKHLSDVPPFDPMGSSSFLPGLRSVEPGSISFRLEVCIGFEPDGVSNCVSFEVPSTAAEVEAASHTSTSTMSHASTASFAASRARTKHLDDPETRRDLFGVVRGACKSCDGCQCYLKRTEEYLGKAGAPHPHNDPNIMRCSRCGCMAEDHEVDVAEDAKERGSDAMAFEDWEEALRWYTKAVENAPRDPVHYSNRAAAYLEKKWYAQALHDADHAIALRPDWAKPRARRAHALLMLGKPKQAQEELQRCVELEPKSMHYKKLLREAEGKLLVQIQREKALKKRQTPPRRRPTKEDAPSYKEMGDQAVKNGEHSMAIQWYTEAIRLEPENAKLWSNRSAARANASEFQAALADACQAIQLEPKWHKAWSRKGFALFCLQQYESASEAYQQALKLDPGNLSIRDALRKVSEVAEDISHRLDHHPQQAPKPIAQGASSPSTVGFSGVSEIKRAQGALTSADLQSLFCSNRTSQENSKQIDDDYMLEQKGSFAHIADRDRVDSEKNEHEKATTLPEDHSTLQAELAVSQERCQELQRQLAALEEAHKKALQELEECKCRLRSQLPPAAEGPHNLHDLFLGECAETENLSSQVDEELPPTSLLDRIMEAEEGQAKGTPLHGNAEDDTASIPSPATYDERCGFSDADVGESIDATISSCDDEQNLGEPEILPKDAAKVQKINVDSIARLFGKKASVQESEVHFNLAPTKDEATDKPYSGSAEDTINTNGVEAHVFMSSTPPQIPQEAGLDSNDATAEAHEDISLEGYAAPASEDSASEHATDMPRVDEEAVNATKAFFEHYMANVSDEEEEDQDANMVENDTWWEAWEDLEEHRASVEASRDQMGAMFSSKHQRRLQERTATAAASSLTVNSLQTIMQTPLRPKHFRDNGGIKRVACKICKGKCLGFVPLRENREPSSELLENHPSKFLKWAACHEDDICAECGCYACDHETTEEAERREIAMEKSRRMQELLHRRKRNERMRRVEAAQRRKEDSMLSEDFLEETRMDGLQHVCRAACKGCDECPGFRIWYRPSSTDSTDADVMFYCSMCGCSALDHEVDAQWEEEERRRKLQAAQEESARRSYTRHYQSQRRMQVEEDRRRQASLDVLGLSSTATPREISRAYRRLALRWHPDKHNGDVKVAQAQFLRVTEAFRHLSATH